LLAMAAGVFSRKRIEHVGGKWHGATLPNLFSIWVYVMADFF
jgi:hypothetical protein